MLLSSQRALPLCLLSFLSLFVSVARASVLAIDYGADFTKVSLMKPGVPFDVLLNRDSKRKIQSTIGWKGAERLFGTDAANIAARFPTESFPSLKFLQGVPYDSSLSQYHSSLYPYLHVSESERSSHLFKRKDNSEWTNEELIAMQFSYIRDLAESVAGDKVRDAIVTVPAWYSQFERQAVIDSLELAGLRALALINDGTAIAVNYAMSRTFPEKEYHIFYDAGASGIRATLVSFHTPPSETASKSKKKSEDATIIEVKGFGYDRIASGTELDHRLRDLIKYNFEVKHGNGKTLDNEPRALAKLVKEATRVKTILSANSESRVTVESFVWDIDFKTTVSRQEFEDICKDLKGRFAKPILDALASAGLTMDDITSVVMAGGISRVPMVQAEVKELVGDKIAFNVNADEASVLGAAFYGASLSPGYRTKPIKVEDVIWHDVQVSYPAESKTSGRIINTVIFPAGSKLGGKKTLTFKRKEDFIASLNYKNVETKGIPSELAEIALTGVSEAIANLTEAGAIEPVVKLTVSLNESGFALFQEAIVYGDIKDDSIAGKLKGFFGGSSSTSSSTETDTDTAATSTESAPESTETPAAKPVTVPNSIPLPLSIKYLSMVPYSVQQKRDARARLVALDTAEAVRRRKEEATNHLEGYLYRLRDLLDGEEKTSFMLFSTPEERKHLEEKLTETFAWMSEEAESAETSALWAKRDALEALEKPIQFRYKENEDAPKELDSLQQALTAGRIFLNSARENRTLEETEGLPHKYTVEELSAIEERLKETETWLQEGVDATKKLKKSDDPVLLSAEMKARGMTLQNQVMKLIRRKAPKVPKKKTTTTSSSSSTPSESPTESVAAEEPAATPGGEGKEEHAQKPIHGEL